MSIEAELAKLAAEVPQEAWDALPDDLTDRLDHYLSLSITGRQVMSNAVEAARKPFTFRERRKMGATLWNVRRIMKDLKADGELGTDSGIIALQVFEVLAVDQQDVFAAAGPGRDWDAFLEFLMKLIEILMKFLPLFI